jgi:hypothetical protein
MRFMTEAQYAEFLEKHKEEVRQAYEVGQADALDLAADGLENAARRVPTPPLNSSAHEYWRGYHAAAIEGRDSLREWARTISAGFPVSRFPARAGEANVALDDLE